MWNQEQGSSYSENLTKIANLRPGVSGQVTAGHVIGKQNLKQVAGKTGEDRGALSFTIFDESGVVNVTCWGTIQLMQRTAQIFHIGDVVKLTNCNVVEKSGSDSEKIYNPSTNVPFRITIDIKTGKIEQDGFMEHLNKLADVLPGDEVDFVYLDQINRSKTTYLGKVVNCLVLVKTTPIKKNIVTKTGRNAVNCEFELIDISKEVVRFVTWLESLADLTYSLTPKQSILFLRDVRVKEDSFTENITLEANSKSIVTVNPNIKGAHELYSFAQKLPDDILTPSIKRITSGASKLPLNCITTHVTIEEIMTELPENGVLNAVLTSFNCTDKGISKKCTGCQKKVHGLCGKAECFGKEIQSYYDFTVSLMDHTGYIDRAKLTGECAEKLIGSPVTFYEDWDNSQKTSCMDRVQLERYKIIFTSFTMPSGIWIQIKQIDSWVPGMNDGS